MDLDVITIEIESVEYECSKEKLSKYSEYFEIMFTKDFAEKNMSKITLNDVSNTSWEYICGYLKDGFIRVEKKNVNILEDMFELLKTADMFQFKTIEEECSKIILRLVKPNNCLMILKKISEFAPEKLIRKIEIYSFWHLNEIAEMDIFDKLDIDDLERYHSDSRLRRSSDGGIGVLAAINKWINSPIDSTNTRYKYYSRLLRCLRVVDQSLDLSSLHNKVQIENLVPEIKSNEVDWLFTRRNVESRIFPKSPCLVGNVFSSGDTSTPFIIKFCESEKKFFPIIRLQQIVCNGETMAGFKVVSEGFDIYLVGGSVLKRESLWNNAVWMYSPMTSEWLSFVSMSRPIRHMSLCLLQNNLYIIGGIGRHRIKQQQVLKLSLSDRLWSNCASLPENFNATACVVFLNYIYVIDYSVIRYDPLKNIWETVDIKPSVKGFTCALADNKYIYLMGNCSNIVFKFNPLMSDADLSVVGHFKHECHQACLIDDWLYSLCQDQHTSDIFCEKMNVITGESVVLYEGKTDSVIADILPRMHGCFSLFTY